MIDSGRYKKSAVTKDRAHFDYINVFKKLQKEREKRKILDKAYVDDSKYWRLKLE